MEETEKHKFLQYLSLETDLKNIQNEGSAFMLYGQSSDPETIALACIFREDTGYKGHSSKNDKDILYFGKRMQKK